MVPVKTLIFKIQTLQKTESQKIMPELREITPELRRAIF